VLSTKPKVDATIADIKKTGADINARVKSGVADYAKLMAYNAERPLAANTPSLLSGEYTGNT
jgi:hypothetical protein